MVSLIAVRSDAVWHALAADDVREILGGRTWVAIPTASNGVPGVIAWRGRAIAVVDLGLVQGAAPWLKSGEVRPRTVVVEARGCTVALPVDLVREVSEVQRAELRAPHATRWTHCSLEVMLHGTAMPVLDLSSLIGSLLGDAPQPK